MTCCLQLFQGLKVKGDMVAYALQVRLSAMFLLLTEETKKYGIEASLNGLICIPSFVTIGQLLLNLKWNRTWWFEKPFFLLGRKEG